MAWIWPGTDLGWDGDAGVAWSWERLACTKCVRLMWQEMSGEGMDIPALSQATGV